MSEALLFKARLVVLSGIAFAFAFAFALAFAAARFLSPSESPPEVADLAPRAQQEGPVLSDSRSTWIDRLATATPSEISKYYELATDDPDRQNLVAHYWSRIDPASFLKFLLPQGAVHFSNPDHAMHLFDEWGRRDFDAAMEAAQSLPTFLLQKETLLRRVVAAQVPFDPEKAIARLDEICANAGSSGAVPVEDKSPDELRSYLAALSKLPQTATLRLEVNNCLEEWLKSDVDGALEWANAHSGNHFRGIFSDLVDLAPLKAADLAVARPEIGPRSDGIQAVARKLAAQGYDHEAAELINNHLAGDSRTMAAQSAAKKAAHSERGPVAGADFALLLEHPAAQAGALSEALKIFIKEDEAGARAWVEALPEGDLKVKANEMVSGAQND